MELRVQNVLKMWDEFENGNSFPETRTNVYRMLLQLAPLQLVQFQRCHRRLDGETWTPYLQIVERLLKMGRSFGFLDYPEPLTEKTLVDFFMEDTRSMILKSSSDISVQLNQIMTLRFSGKPYSFYKDFLLKLPLCTKENLTLFFTPAERDNEYANIFVEWMYRETMKVYTEFVAAGNPFERCVVCGAMTPYKKYTHVGLRECYREGLGQLCMDCEKTL